MDRTRKLYCLGDSLTFGLGVRFHLRWTNLAAQESKLDIINLGICGDTTSGMLARLHGDIRPLLPPNALQAGVRVLLMGGCNDIFYTGSSSTAQANMGAMVHELISYGVEPIVGIPLPVASEKAPGAWRKLVDFEEAAAVVGDYCVWLRGFCTAFCVRCVDFREDFLCRDGRIKNELLLDGLHPTAEGHRLMAARLTRFLKEG